MLNPTPPHVLCDAGGHPYFLWDCDVTLEQFRGFLRDPDPGVRDFWLGTLVRQAKPDDVLSLVSAAEIRAAWPRIAYIVGRERPFWEWYIARVARLGD